MGTRPTLSWVIRAGGFPQMPQARGRCGNPPLLFPIRVDSCDSRLQRAGMETRPTLLWVIRAGGFP